MATYFTVYAKMIYDRETKSLHTYFGGCSQTPIVEQSHEKFTSQFEIQNKTDIFSFLFKDLNCSKEKCNPLI